MNYRFPYASSQEVDALFTSQRCLHTKVNRVKGIHANSLSLVWVNICIDGAFVDHCCHNMMGFWSRIYSNAKQHQAFFTHLCDFFSDIVGSVFDLRCYDGCLGCWWRVSFLISPLSEVECNQRDLVDGAILVDIRIRGRAKKAGLHMIKRA